MKSSYRDILSRVRHVPPAGDRIGSGYGTHGRQSRRSAKILFSDLDWPCVFPTSEMLAPTMTTNSLRTTRGQVRWNDRCTTRSAIVERIQARGGQDPTFLPREPYPANRADGVLRRCRRRALSVQHEHGMIAMSPPQIRSSVLFRLRATGPLGATRVAWRGGSNWRHMRKNIIPSSHFDSRIRVPGQANAWRTEGMPRHWVNSAHRSKSSGKKKDHSSTAIGS